MKESDYAHLLDVSPAVLYRCVWHADEPLPEVYRDAPWASHATGCFVPTYISGQVRHLTGFTAEACMAADWWMSHIHPEDIEGVFHHQAQLFTQDESKHQYRLRTSAGEYIWIEDRVRLLKSDDGQPLEIVGSWLDVSEVRTSGQMYQQLVEHAFDGIAILQHDSVAFVNTTITKMWGGRREEMLNRPFLEFVHPDDYELVKEKYRGRISGDDDGHPYELRLLQKDGSTIWAESAGNLIEYGGQPADMLILRDISERKKAERAIRASEQKYRSLFEDAYDMIHIVDTDGLIIDVNRSELETLGYTREELIGRHVQDIVCPDYRDGVVECIRRLLSGDKVRLEESALQGKSGESIFVEVSATPQYDDQGKVIAWRAILRDTSGVRREAERLRRILDADFDAVIVHQDMQVVFSNEAAREMFAYASFEDAIGVSPLDHMGESFRRLASVLARKMTRTRKRVGRLEIDVCDPRDGKLFPIEIASTAIDWSGRPAVVSIFRDIRVRKAAEAALIRREQQMAVLAEAGRSLNEDLDEWQVLHQLVKCAMRLVQAAGGAVAQCVDGEMVFSEYMHGEESVPVDLKFPRGYGVPGYVLATGKTYMTNDAQHDKYVIPEIRESLGFNKLVDTPIFDAKGALLGCFEMHDSVDGRDFDTQDVEMLKNLSNIASGAIRNSRLIADLQNLTATLKHSESRYRDLVELMPDGIVLVEEGKVVFANPEALRLYGYQEKDAIGQPIMARIHPDDRAMAIGRVEKLLQNKQGFNPLVEERMLRFDGSEFIAETASSYVENEGRPSVLVVLRDVSERVAAQQAVQQSAETMRAVARNMAGVVFQFSVRNDGVWCLPFVAESIERYLGVSADAVMADAKVLFDRVHPEDVDGCFAAIEAAVAERAAFAWQGRFVSLEGAVMWFSCSSEPLTGADGSVVWNGVAVDESRQHELENEFRQAQKMESVGILVGGIAHDFNNMLAGMLGQLYLVKLDINSGQMDAEKVVARLDAVDSEGRGAAQVISQLLTFARKGEVSLKPVDMNRLVADAMRLHRVSIPENIGMDMQLEQVSLMVHGDGGMIQQMLLNLLTNARDALEGCKNPHIDISLSYFVPDAAFLEAHPAFDVRTYVLLAVCDNGCGIEMASLEHIFDPFFTTKEVGKGSGLGLSMIYGGMQTHGGQVLVSSEVGRGSVFQLYFPLLDGAHQAETVEAVKVVYGRGQTVLLADDQPMLLDVFRQLLVSLNYVVLTAVDGEQALAVFEEHRGDIELALLDVVMPEKGGLEVAEILREANPDLPIIFHTGYGEEAKLEAMQAWPRCITVKKPVSIEVLSHYIADILQ